MPIVFQGLEDPYGLVSASSALAKAMMQNAMMDRQEKSLLNQERRAEARAIGAEKRHEASLINKEKRAEERALSAEERAIQRLKENESRSIEQRRQFGGALKSAMDIVQNPDATPMQKIGALAEYATLSGDQKGVAPIINQIIKDNTRQQESKDAMNFLRAQGVNIPEGTLPPTSFLGAFAQSLKPTYEPESDKIEAKRTSSIADRIVNDYEASQSAASRLKQMEIAANSGQLPTPAMVKTMDFFGVPLSIFANPLSEAYEKNVNEYIKDVANYFPGQIRVAEIEPYMKTIPTLMNSDDGKKLIIENQRLINDQKEANYEAYKELLKENNGRKPKNLDVQILERTRPIRSEIADKLKKNFENAVEMSKFPTSRVPPGTKLTVDKARNYFNRAGGNRAKAEEMARKDGYEF